MNRRDFLKQLFTLTVTLPLIPTLSQATHTFGGWFKPEGEEWKFVVGKYNEQAAIKFDNTLYSAMQFDGHIARCTWMSGEALPDEQIEALYQESRQWFG